MTSDHYNRDQGDSSPQILVFYNKRLGWGFGMTTTTTTITTITMITTTTNPSLKFRIAKNDNDDNQSFIKISDCKE